MKVKSKGFTLIELLIVLALIAILATILTLIIKPTEILKKARDSQRIANLKQIENIFNTLYTTDPTFSELNYFSVQTVYLSLPDSSSTCGSWSSQLPPLPSGWSYHCSATPTNIDGSGWLPLNFNNFSILNLAQLPLDPLNQPPYYYSFVVGGSYKLTAKPEINYGPAINDGGIEPLLYEVGSDLKLSTFQSGLVGYWSFDEGTGTIAYDKSGYGNNGTMYSSTTPTDLHSTSSCKIGYCVSFDGVDDYVEVPYSPSLNPDNFTVLAWANVKGGSGIYRSLITSRDDFPQRGYIIYAASNNKWATWIGNGSAWVKIDDSDIVLNKVSFIVSKYSNSLLSIYVDGVLKGSIGGILIKNTARPLRIGTGATEGSPQYFFNGLIDEVRVYNRALSDSEIKALYEATK